MSASLVGSEMCIRDRAMPRRRWGVHLLRLGGVRRSALCVLASVGWPWACLLYTSDAADDM
eukprot:11718648-Alexandrium_andersonii.AAC.1